MATAALTQKYFVATREAPSADDHLITISTINPDRDGDRVIPEGGDFTEFMKNPVLMWAHGAQERYGAVPIGAVTGLNIEPGVGVKASFRFLENDPFADRIANAYRQDVIRASSIGFKPVKATPNGQGLDHEQWSLLELSLCSVPTNPDCVRTLKSLGFTDEEIESPIPEEKATPGTVQKRGRVLSAVNESRLRAAMDALANAGAVLTEVLTQLMPMPDDMDEEEEHPKPKPMASGELRLILADEDLEGPILTLVDDAGHEPTFVIDPMLMRTVISDAVRAQIQQAIVEPIGESVQRALDHARGRVH